MHLASPASRPARLPAALLACMLAMLLLPASAAAMDTDMEMDMPGRVTPTAPAAGDARFMPGTVGPIVFRGTAATVTIPDGAGFGGERGRMQNAGDLRKNNYSVTDPNYNNVLGLLPRNPDGGAPLTYVQHIQLYAAAGFIEAFAPDTYEHMAMHQNRGEGTVLGAAGFLMGLVSAFDPAAHGLDPASIPATLPGTTIDSRNYVRAARDATGQAWARPHHAQTAPAVFRMLVEAGVNASTALVLASDDGISGAGRLNGMNEQNGDRDGFNAGERATWAFAAQVQLQTSIPVVMHLLQGHGHATLDSSALTKPKVNTLIGMAADDRSASDARATALYDALRDGRVATAATAAADQDLTVRDASYLRPRSALDVDLDSPFDWRQDVGTERVVNVRVINHGPHFVRDVALMLEPSAQLRIVSFSPPPGVTCMAEQLTCRLGGVSAETAREVVIPVTVRFVAPGTTTLGARLTSTSSVETAQLTESDEYGAYQKTTATIGIAAGRTGIATSSCGLGLRTSCVVRRTAGASLVASARPATYGERDRRKVEVVYEQRVGRTWRQRSTQSLRVAANGAVRLRATSRQFTSRGAWRVRVVAAEHGKLYAGTSAWRYLALR